MNFTKDDIQKWVEADANLKYWKAKEMELRMALAMPMLKGKKAGTHTVVIDGMQCKPVKKYNYSINEEEYSDIEEDLTEAEKGCIRIKHELSMRQYNALDRELKGKLNSCITVKPGTPGFAVKDLNAKD